MPTDIASNADTTQSSTQTVLLCIRGINNAGSTRTIEKAASNVDGVLATRVNVTTGDAVVEYEPEITRIADVLDAIQKTGLVPCLPETESADPYGIELDEEVDLWWHRFCIGVGLMACLILATTWTSVAGAVIALLGLLRAGVSIQASYWISVLANLVQPAQLLVGSLLYVYVGFPFFWRALKQTRYGSVSTDTLIGLGVTIAFGHGVFQLLYSALPPRLVFVDVGLIAGFVSLGRFLELRMRRQAMRSVRHLLSLRPHSATISENGVQVVKRLSEIQRGDTVLIQTGDRIPLDATVVSGESATDVSWLKGESPLLNKSVGDRLLAGSLNMGRSMSALVTATNQESFLSRIIDLARKAQCSHAQGQPLVDRAVCGYILAVLLVSVVTLLAWGRSGDWEQGIRCAVAVVIVACPCALSLAMPSAIMAACQRGLQQGIVIKNAQALAAAQRLSCIILDESSPGPQEKKAIRQLKRMGVITMIVSGDAISAAVEGAPGVDELVDRAKLGERDLVKKMQSTGHRVAMVGDGIRDKAALAAADLGIAMDVDGKLTFKAGDILFTRGRAKQVLTVVKLARATMTTIRRSLTWLVVYNIFLIPLAAGLLIPLTRFVPWGWLILGQLALPPSLAAAATAASSVLVVSQSLRLITRPDI